MEEVPTDSLEGRLCPGACIRVHGGCGRRYSQPGERVGLAQSKVGYDGEWHPKDGFGTQVVGGDPTHSIRPCGYCLSLLATTRSWPDTHVFVLGEASEK